MKKYHGKQLSYPTTSTSQNILTLEPHLLLSLLPNMILMPDSETDGLHDTDSPDTDSLTSSTSSLIPYHLEETEHYTPTLLLSIYIHVNEKLQNFLAIETHLLKCTRNKTLILCIYIFCLCHWTI